MIKRRQKTLKTNENCIHSFSSSLIPFAAYTEYFLCLAKGLVRSVGVLLGQAVEWYCTAKQNLQTWIHSQEWKTVQWYLKYRICFTIAREPNKLSKASIHLQLKTGNYLKHVMMTNKIMKSQTE